MKKALTNKTVEALKPQGKRYEVRDAYCPGFGVRITPNGRKTFFVSYRYGIDQRRPSIGIYPITSLSNARTQAIAILRDVAEGIDPQYARSRDKLTLREGVEAFITQYAKPRNKSWREAERVLDRELVSRFGEREIEKMTRGDILVASDAAMARGAKYQANRIVSNARKLFNWFLERGIIDVNPLTGIRAPAREKSRDRVLTDDELARVIAACRNMTYPFGPYTLMLLATAQRRSEVTNMRWSEIDFEKRNWEIPAERSKNGKSHNVPLSDFALKILGDVSRFPDCDFVFTTTRRSPISGITKMHRRICDISETNGWRLHDLRRTASSKMAEAGIQLQVAEKVLNHISGSLAGVAGVYNRYHYEPEKRAALESWAEILSLLEASYSCSKGAKNAAHFANPC
ncbi:tyrosine-type recombinase/integrase [Parasphingorhabdus sp.]|uniref:tyrosine-type recombinase/integrase n=1 Tax=Parasphingorhabdus sp. TaxID=2709688 RepID=UPI003D2C3446